MNTDGQALEMSAAPIKVKLGVSLTRGLGAGGNPEVGRKAAEESKTEVRKILEGTDMVFITAGMGGGTGTGGAPVIAEIARELGILTIAVITKPFFFEGPRRAKLAEEGINNLLAKVDTMITIPNDRLINVVERRTSLIESFQIADDVLRQGVQGISEIITTPGNVNVDFADVRAVMSCAGPALMGIGYGTGEQRALQAAKAAVSSPLLEQSVQGAKGLLVNFTGDEDLTLAETAEAMHYINELCDSTEANIYFGTVIDPNMRGNVRVTVLATGFRSISNPSPTPSFDFRRFTAQQTLQTQTPKHKPQITTPQAPVQKEQEATTTSTLTLEPPQQPQLNLPGFMRPSTDATRPTVAQVTKPYETKAQEEKPQ
jgi:cell division protein FtsZ